MSTAVTSTRSVAMATVLGILVAASFVALAGDLWELGLPASLAAGALALVTPLQLRDGRFFSQGGRQGRFLLVLAQLMIFTLAYTVATALGLERSTGLLLFLVIVLAGAAAYSVGFVAGALNQFEDDGTTNRATLPLRR